MTIFSILWYLLQKIVIKFISGQLIKCHRRLCRDNGTGFEIRGTLPYTTECLAFLFLISL